MICDKCPEYQRDWCRNSNLLMPRNECFESFMVGDEVIVEGIGIGFVTGWIELTDEIFVTTKDGWSDRFSRMIIKKTGKHFPQIAEVLSELKEEDNEISKAEYKN